MLSERGQCITMHRFHFCPISMSWSQMTFAKNRIKTNQISYVLLQYPGFGYLLIRSSECVELLHCIFILGKQLGIYMCNISLESTLSFPTCKLNATNKYIRNYKLAELAVFSEITNNNNNNSKTAKR